MKYCVVAIKNLEWIVVDTVTGQVWLKTTQINVARAECDRLNAAALDAVGSARAWIEYSEYNTVTVDSQPILVEREWLPQLKKNDAENDLERRRKWFGTMQKMIWNDAENDLEPKSILTMPLSPSVKL